MLYNETFRLPIPPQAECAIFRERIFTLNDISTQFTVQTCPIFRWAGYDTVCVADGPLQSGNAVTIHGKAG